MTLQKIPLELVAGDDRAFVVRVEKDGEPLDLVDADLRGPHVAMAETPIETSLGG